MIQCSRCKLAVYCSSKCFNADQERHGKFCAVGVLSVEHKAGARSNVKTGGGDDPNLAAVTVEAVTNDDEKGGRTQPQTHPLQVTLDKPIKLLKDELQTLTGLPTTQQVLLLNNNNSKNGTPKELLGNQKSAKEHGISKGCTLQLEPKNIKLHIQMPSSKSSSSKKKKKSSKKKDKDKFTLTISHRNTNVTDLKELIEEETGLDADELILQKMVVQGDNEPLKSGVKAYALGLQHLDTIQVVPKHFKIEVQLPRRSNSSSGDKATTKATSISVSHKDKGKDVLEKIKAKASSDALTGDDYYLYNGDQTLSLDKKLSDAGVGDGDILRLEPAQIELAVTHGLTGEVIQVCVNPSKDTLADLREQVHAKTGLAPDNQTWRHAQTGKPLGSDKQNKDPQKALLKDCDIVGATLEVEPQQIQIHAEVANGETSKVAIQIAPSDTLAEIKARIEEQTGMAAAKQLLSTKSSKSKSSKKAPLPTDETTTVRDLKLQDGDKLIVASNSRTVQISLPDNTHIPLDVALQDTTEDIKNKIEEKTNGKWKVAQQLVKDNRGREMVSGKTAEQIGIKDGDYLVVQVNKVPVTIQSTNGDPIQVMVDPMGDTIGDIKQQLESASGIPAKSMKLFKDGKELDKSKKLAVDCGITEGAVLSVERKSMQIQLDMPNGDQVSLKLKPTDTVEDIKKKIKKETGMGTSKQILKINGNELSKKSTLGELGLTESDTIQVEAKSMTMNVTLPDGKKVPVDIAAKDTAKKIKAKIEKETGVSAAQQVLRDKEGNELGVGDKSSLTAKDFGFLDGDDLVVDIRKERKRVRLALPDGTDKSMEIEADVPLIEILSKIPDIDWARHVIKDKAGKELDTSKSAQGLGIDNGEELHVAKKPIKNVKFQLPDGSSTTIDLEADEPLVSIQDKLPGVEWSRYSVKKNGKLLDPTGTAEFLNLKPGDVLQLDLKSKKITINMPDGTTKEIEVKPAEKLEDSLPGIEWSRYSVKRNGKLLDPSQTADFLNLDSGAVLDFDMKTKKVTINMPDGTKKTLEMKPEEKLEDAIPGFEWSRYTVKKNGKEVNPGDTAEFLNMEPGDVLNFDLKTKQVTITMPDGTKKVIEMKPDEKLEDALPGVEWSRYAVKKNGEELDPGMTAEQLNLGPGDTLSFDMKSKKVTITMPDGTKKVIEMKPDDKLVDILPGVEWSRNTVRKSNGKELEPEMSVELANIQEGDVLHVDPKSKKVTIVMPDGTKKVIEMKPDDKLVDILPGVEWSRNTVRKSNGKELEPEMSVELANIQEGDVLNVEHSPYPVKVESIYGDEYEITVDPSKDKVCDVKDKIAAISGIPSDNQRLFLKGGEVGNDKERAPAAGIIEDCVLQMEPKSVNVGVLLPDGKKLPLTVTPSDSGLNIKKKIGDKAGIPVKKQTLKTYGDNVDDGKTVRDLGLQEGDDSLEVEVPPEVINTNVLMPDGKKVPIAVKPSHTAGDIKKMIEEKTGTLARDQTLKMFGDPLPNSKTVAEMDLHEGDDSLEVEIPKPKPAEAPKRKFININVLMPDGKKVEIKVKPSNDADDIKDKVAGVTGTPREKQILKQYGDQVPDEKTVEEMGLEEGDDSLEVELVPDPDLSYRHRRPVEEERERVVSDSSDSSDSEPRSRKRGVGKSRARPPRPTMGDTPLERAYRWYVRIMSPSYKGMCDSVRKTAGMDITVEDVNLLPWIKKGKILDYELLTEMLDEIQAKRKALTGCSF